jgi:hypothetical protein
MKSLVPLFIALTIASSVALAQLPYNPPQCVVISHLIVNTYIGPIVIDDVCMTLTRYLPGQLQFQGIDLADGIFRDGFDGTQP